MLFRKMLRDMRARKGQFLSILIMSLIGLFIYAGINAEWVGMQKVMDEYYEETNMADYWAYGTEFTDSDIDELLETEGVEDASFRLILDGTADLSDDPTVTLHIADNFDICSFQVIEGKEFEEESKGIWLDKNFAEANDISVGDTITITAYGMAFEQEVKALVINPEYIYTTSDSELPNYKKYGFAFLSSDVLDMQVPWNSIYITTNNNKDLEASIEDALEGSASEVINRDSLASHVTFTNEIEQHRAMGRVFPLAFLIIATLTVVTTMTRLVASQRTQIGTLKALGFKKRKILVHYMSYGFWLSGLGAVLGIILGSTFFTKFMFSMMQSQYVLPRYEKAISPMIFILATVSVIICTLAAFLACRKALSEAPAETLRPKGPSSFKLIGLEKTRIWQKIGFSMQWNLRDVMRSRMRSLMVIIGVAGCSMLIIGAFGLLDSYNDMLDWQFNEIYNFDAKLTPEEGANIDVLAEKYDSEIVYGASVEVLYENNKESGSLTSVEEGSNMTRFYTKTRDEMQLPATGISVSYNLAKTLGVDVGDSLSWHIYGDTEWYDIEVTAIHRIPLGKEIAMTTGSLDELGLDLSSYVYLTTNGKVSSNEDGISSVQTVAEMRSDYESMAELFYIMVVIIVVAASLLVGVVLYNLGILSYTERERDMATLRVLGFKAKKLRWLMLMQNLWLTCIGAILGFPLGYWLIGYMANTLTTEFDMMTIITPLSMLIGIGGTIGISILLSYIFAGKIKYLDMVSALKATE